MERPGATGRNFAGRVVDRLRRENEQLNRRVDSLILMLEREQVLRQQMQGQLDRLMERLAPPAPPPPPEPPPRLERAEPDRAEERQALRERLQATEAKFDVLTQAVAQLVAHLARRKP